MGDEGVKGEGACAVVCRRDGLKVLRIVDDVFGGGLMGLFPRPLTLLPWTQKCAMVL